MTIIFQTNAGCVNGSAACRPADPPQKRTVPSQNEKRRAFALRFRCYLLFVICPLINTPVPAGCTTCRSSWESRH